MTRFEDTRFWGKVDRSGDCWLWTASVNRGAYGQFHIVQDGVRRTVRAHRYSYELLIGPIPDGLTLDHLCRNPRCVNPEHLEPVPIRENVLRGDGVTAMNARKTHCKHGHEFTPENTYWQADPPGRLCRACLRESRRRTEARHPRKRDRAAYMREWRRRKRHAV